LRVFLDITRIASRIARSTPTGIDRVEFAWAKSLFHSEMGASFGVLTTPRLAGALSGERVARVMDGVEAAWGLGGTAAQDPMFQALKRWLSSPIALEARKPARFFDERRTRLSLADWAKLPFGDLVGAGRRLKREATRGPSAYIHVSHLFLERPRAFAWARRDNVARVFMLHDSIPVEFPEFCRPRKDALHMRRLKTLSELASLIITNSRDSERSIRALLKEQGWRAPDIAVTPLGVAEAFADPSKLDPPAPATPYFVCVGTIEPRKNLAFLLIVWRRLVQTLGARAPRLVLVGRRGWENENVVDILDRSQVLAPYLAEVADLTDPGLASLMAGASAFLAPSLAEGYGMPLAEALAVGAPAIASDIPSHREIAGDLIPYFDIVDGRGWMEAIKAYSAAESPARAKAKATLSGRRRTSWEDHVRVVLGLAGQETNCRTDQR